MFKRRKTEPEDPLNQVSKAEQRRMEDQARWQAYCDHANSLPLLSDEELHRFAMHGEAVNYTNPLGNTFYLTEFSAQFIIRLRRTLLARESETQS